MAVWVIASEGLANRLRAIAGYVALAELRNEEIRICWPLQRACPERFDRLFEPESLPGVRFVDTRPPSGGELPGTVYREMDWWGTLWERHGAELASRDDFEAAALRVLRGLRPRKHILAGVDAVLQGHGLALAVGVHLRLTDNLSEGWPSTEVTAAHPLVRACSRLLGEALSRGRPVFLSTDNRYALQVLRKQHEGLWAREVAYRERGAAVHRLVLVSKGAGFRSGLAKLALRAMGPEQGFRTTSMSDAVTDLWLLARCSEVHVTPGSSFGELAAHLGGRQAIPLLGAGEQ